MDNITNQTTQVYQPMLARAHDERDTAEQNYLSKNISRVNAKQHENSLCTFRDDEYDEWLVANETKAFTCATRDTAILDTEAARQVMNTTCLIRDEKKAFLDVKTQELHISHVNKTAWRNNRTVSDIARNNARDEE